MHTLFIRDQLNQLEAAISSIADNSQTYHALRAVQQLIMIILEELKDEVQVQD